jgi:RNA polymerase sigma-70 factor (ECF subfamily)
MTESERVNFTVCDGAGSAISGSDARDESIAAPEVAQALLQDMAGLRSQLARVTGSKELAADMLQDAIVTALQKVRAGELSSRRELDGFVYRTALNHLRNHRRKARWHISDTGAAEMLADPQAGCPTEDVAAAQWTRLAREILLEVNSRDRELLARFYLHDEPKEELCRRYGLSALHFNRVIFRARERFRDLLQSRGLGRSDFFSLLTVL